KAAAALAHPLARAFERDPIAFGRQPDAQRPAALDGVSVDAADLFGGFDEPFAEREADRIIVEVRRRRHHHRIADAADLDRYRRFDRDAADQRRIAGLGEAETADGEVDHVVSHHG